MVEQYKFRKERLPISSNILIANDMAEFVGGTRTVYKNLEQQLRQLGYCVDQISPFSSAKFRKIQTPHYPELLSVINPFPSVFHMLETKKPHAIHIATIEQPIGLATLFYCTSKKIPYTASYRIDLPAYLSIYSQQILGNLCDINPDSFSSIVKALYSHADTVFVPTPTAEKQLHMFDITNTVLLPRGVDTECFRPLNKDEINVYENYDWYRSGKPIVLYVGRLSAEKNLQAVLTAPNNNMEYVIIGSGPNRNELENRFSNNNIHFLGAKFNEDLAQHYRGADIFAFPSITDLHPNTVVEALSSGLPIVAYNTHGQTDIVIDGKTGILAPLDTNLNQFIPHALQLSREECRKSVEDRTWRKSAMILAENLAMIHDPFV